MNDIIPQFQSLIRDVEGEVRIVAAKVDEQNYFTPLRSVVSDQ